MTPETAMSDLLPETLPREVEITDPTHILFLGEMHGLLGAVELLEAIPDARRTPGFSYALALIAAKANAARADVIVRNMRAIAKAGVDIVAMQNIAARGTTMICTPYPPGEEA